MKAHGQIFRTKADADARIAEINEENFKYGVSDGRVTEILTIIDMMILWEWELTPVQAFRKQHDTWAVDGHFITAKERGIEVGSRVAGVSNIWGKLFPWTGTVTHVYNASVCATLDTPFEAEGPYVGDWKTYDFGTGAPGRLRLESDIW